MINPEALRDIRAWTDEDLVDLYRHLKSEVVYDSDDYPRDMDPPGPIVEDEITRRGLMPDREDVIPEPYDPTARNALEDPA